MLVIASDSLLAMPLGHDDYKFASVCSRHNSACTTRCRDLQTYCLLEHHAQDAIECTPPVAYLFELNEAPISTLVLDGLPAAVISLRVILLERHWGVNAELKYIVVSKCNSQMCSPAYQQQPAVPDGTSPSRA